MFLRLLAAFILIPLIELFLLIKLSQATNVGTTILIVIGTGLLGSWLARREGAIAWFRFQEALGQGRVPSREIQDGLMIVFAAALLLTPGLLTDAVGFTLLIPPGRALVRKYILARYFKDMKIQVGGTGSHGMGGQEGPFDRGASGSTDPNTIDAKAVHRN